MEYDGVIDLLLAALWLLGCLPFATFLIEFGKDMLAHPRSSSNKLGAPRPDTERLARTFLALPRSFDEFPMPAELLNKVLPNSTHSLPRGKTIQASYWVCKGILLSRQS
jgi:hypothetical protein